MSRTSTPKKRKMDVSSTQDTEDDFAEEGQGGQSTAKANIIQNIYPKFLDVPVTLTINYSSNSTQEMKLDMRNIYQFDTWRLTPFKTRLNNSGLKSEIFEEFVDKLEARHWSIRFLHSKSSLKFLQGYRVETNTTGTTTTKTTNPCSQPILIARPRHIQTNYLPEEITPTGNTWKGYYKIINSHDIETYGIGDEAILEEKHYDEHWIRDHIKTKQDGHENLKIGHYFNSLIVKGGRNPWMGYYTLPIDQQYSNNSDMHLDKNQWPLEGRYIQGAYNGLAGFSHTRIQNKPIKRNVPKVIVQPISDGSNGMAEGYINYDFHRQVSFVVRLWSQNGDNFDQHYGNRLANWACTTKNITENTELAMCDNFTNVDNASKSHIAWFHEP